MQRNVKRWRRVSQPPVPWLSTVLWAPSRCARRQAGNVCRERGTPQQLARPHVIDMRSAGGALAGGAPSIAGPGGGDGHRAGATRSARRVVSGSRRRHESVKATSACNGYGVETICATACRSSPSSSTTVESIAATDVNRRGRSPANQRRPSLMKQARYEMLIVRSVWRE